MSEPQAPVVASNSLFGVWVQWSAGWGWTMKLCDGLTLTVSKSMARTEGFKWSALGSHGVKSFEKQEDAMAVAERYARKTLTLALNRLPNPTGQAANHKQEE